MLADAVVSDDTGSLSNEVGLLLSTATVPPDEEAVQRALDAGVSWPALSALTQRERAAPVVLKSLPSVDRALGDPGFQEFRQSATLAVMQSLQLEQLLHEVVEGLAGDGIDVMLLKGAGLAYTAFPSFADRPMGDLDLLVRAQHAEKAWLLLQERGWTWPSTDRPTTLYVGHHHLPPLLRESGLFRLELHHGLFPDDHPFRFSIEDMWARARRVEVRGHPVTVPHPIHQLWHVCVHFAWSHLMRWGAWRTFRDAAAIVGKRQIDWTEFVDFARDSRAVTCCYWTLRLAHRLARVPVPGAALAALRPQRPERMLAFLERHYVSNLFPSDRGSPSTWLSLQLWNAGISPGSSGHGSFRPWHASERWRARSEDSPGKPTTIDRASLPDRMRHLLDTVAYVRRVNRFALVAEPSLPLRPGSLHDVAASR